MELKCYLVDFTARVAGGSNRTFMELKSRTSGIHPLEERRSNRTFMELKYDVNAFKESGVDVLIVPLWN